MQFLIKDYTRDINDVTSAIVAHIEGDTDERIGGYYVYAKHNNSSQIVSGNEFASATAAGVKHLFGGGNASTLEEAIAKANRM